MNGNCCARCALPLPQRPTPDLTRQADSTAQILCGHCLTSPTPFVETIAPYLYRPPVDYMVKRLKFAGELKYSRIIGELMSRAVLARPDRYQPDILVAVPLHQQRLRERGYNQAEQVATILAKRLAISIDRRSTIRVTAPSPQAQLGARARDLNIKRAFEVVGDVRGKRIAIIDDVYTTGATCRSLANSLHKAGAAGIAVWVFARTP